MSFKTILLIAIAMLAAAGYVLFGKPAKSPVGAPAPRISSSAMYQCVGGATLSAGYGDGVAKVRLDNGREFVLAQGISASGARYSNEDGSVVFWNKGRAAFLIENGVETYRECNEAGQPAGNGNDAVDIAIAAYPDLARYKTQSLPPASIQKERGNGGWNIAFIESGSGVPSILTAKCYYVSDAGLARPIGAYRKSEGDDLRRISPSTCQALP